MEFWFIGVQLMEATIYVLLEIYYMKRTGKKVWLKPLSNKQE
jgi:hypothetical protein